MCGRFTLFATPVQVADLFGTAAPADQPPRYNIAPTQPVLACRLDPHRHARELVRLRWGLVPMLQP
jgi:putative SOS response-associated peptidase YedK